MHKEFGVPAAVVLLLLLTVVLYPAILLGSRVAPEASLLGTAPWREQWGPHPRPLPNAVRVARTLAPRLASIAHDGFSSALWNPYIGGGRVGWLGSPDEGGTPLLVAAGLLAAEGWGFTALVATTIALAFTTSLILMRRLGASSWAAAAGALAYALSGAVATSLLRPAGSAVALGPLALVVALSPATRPARRLAGWGAILILLAWSGSVALQFVVLAAVLSLVRRPRSIPATVLPLAGAALLAVMSLAPRLWLDTAAREPGATPSARSVGAPLGSLAALVTDQTDQLATAASSGQLRPEAVDAAAFLGVPILLLALIGLTRLRGATDLLVPGAVFVGLGMAFAPERLVVLLGLGERPFALVALGVAVLAAKGTDRLLEVEAVGHWRDLVGALACVAVATRLVPVAAQYLPYAQTAESGLPQPIPAAACADGSRLVALLDTLPPDIGAALSLRDARAAELGDEPTYAAALGAEPGGLLPVGSALDPRLAGLGVRWVLEPLPLRVVSGEIFAAVDLRTARRVEFGPGWADYAVEDPDGVLRVGLPVPPFADATVAERRSGRTVPLLPDTTLTGETAAWSWWSLSPWASGRQLVLRVESPAMNAPSRVEVALDRSHMSLVGESLGARVWRREDAYDLVRAVPGAAAKVRLLRASPGRVDVQATCFENVTLNFLVKYRPGLRRATIDGRVVEVGRADRLWSAVEVPRGTHRVVLDSRLPAATWAMSLAALAAVAMAWVGRRT